MVARAAQRPEELPRSLGVRHGRTLLSCRDGRVRRRRLCICEFVHEPERPKRRKDCLDLGLPVS